QKKRENTLAHSRRNSFAHSNSNLQTRKFVMKGAHNVASPRKGSIETNGWRRWCMKCRFMAERDGREESSRLPSFRRRLPRNNLLKEKTNTRPEDRDDHLHRVVLPGKLAQIVPGHVPVRRRRRHEPRTVLLLKEARHDILVRFVQRLQPLERRRDDALGPVANLGPFEREVS
ncbi:hypothetical protein THAOC_30007, partial [Thalassiosira oceanica]